MSLKLDMSKAYDRLEWDYLECTLTALGFPNRFTKLVMQCVKTATFSILVNGSPKGPIIPSRRLCKGESLSPYLFLLCMEGLVSLLKEAAHNGCLAGIRVCRGAPSANHLLFTNNSLIF